MGDIYAVGKSAATHYKVDSRQGTESWTDRDGKARTAHIELADVPLAARGRQRWEAAGSPKWVRVPDPEGAVGSVYLDMSTTRTGRGSWMPSDGLYYGMTRAQIAELPTRPEALRDVLLDLKGNWRAVSSNTGKES